MPGERVSMVDDEGHDKTQVWPNSSSCNQGKQRRLPHCPVVGSCYSNRLRRPDRQLNYCICTIRICSGRGAAQMGQRLKTRGESVDQISRKRAIKTWTKHRKHNNLCGSKHLNQAAISRTATLSCIWTSHYELLRDSHWGGQEIWC